MADGDSDSDSSFVLVSDGTSVGSDSESFVIVKGDNCASSDSDGDVFGESQDELEKVVDDDKHVSSDEDDQFCDSHQQLEKSGDDNSCVSIDSDEDLGGQRRHQLKKLVDYSSSDSDEVVFDCGGSLQNGKNVGRTSEVCTCE